MKPPVMIKSHDFQQLLGSLPPDRRRLAELGARIWDGDNRVRFILQFLADFDRSEEILRYLIKEGFTGKKLWDWVQGEFSGSVLQMAAYVLMKINKETEIKPIIAGRDLRG